MTDYLIRVIIVLAITGYIVIRILQRASYKKNIGFLELEIDRAVPHGNTTHLYFQDVVLPNGEHVQEMDLSISTVTYLEMRNRKQFKLNVEFIKYGKMIEPKFHSLASR